MMTKIRCSNDVYDIMVGCFDERQIGIKEMFFLLCLDRANNERCISKISEGGISGTVTDVRLVFATALLSLASGIIICHNHPSGNIQASESDSRITQKLKDAGNIMDIQLMDHIIINGLLNQTNK
jgi:DNA repair protein RadC